MGKKQKQEQEQAEQLEQTEQTEDATGQESAEQAQPENGGEVEFNAEQQAKIDTIISERLKREREGWEKKLEQERERARREAEEEQLEEQEEYRKLAEKRQERLAELEVEVEKAQDWKRDRDRLRTTLKGVLEQRRDGLPDHVIALLDRLDPVEQLEYLAENAEALQKPRPAGPPESPRPQEKGELTQDERAAMTARTW